MASGQNAFDRWIINTRERPISGDVNGAQSVLHRSLMEFVDQFFGRRVSDSDDTQTQPSSGFLGNGFRVRTVSGQMRVSITAGLGFFTDAALATSGIDSISNLDDLARVKPVYLTANQNIDVDAAPSAGNARKDIIEIKIDRRRENTLSRGILDPATGVFNATSVLKNLAFYLDGRNGRVVSPSGSTTGIGYKVGTPAAFGGDWSVIPEPATTSGYVKIATLLVANGVTEVAANRITDDRPLLFPGNVARAGFQVQKSLVPSIAANGNVMHPGVQIAAVDSGSTTVHSFTVYVIAGRGMAVAYPFAYIMNGLDGGTRVGGGGVPLDLEACHIHTVSLSVLTGGEVTTLASATPAIQAAQGQARLKFTVVAAKVTGAAPVALGYTPLIFCGADWRPIAV
jgi:hypothetical protein